MATRPSMPLTEAELRVALRNKLGASALDESDGKTMQLKVYGSKEVEKLGLPYNVEGFMIPYFNIERKRTTFFRFRYMRDTRKGFDAVTGKKAVRYAQPANTETELYFPPFVEWTDLVKKAEIPLIFTEGELKSACATRHGYPTVGLGGVWSFQSKKHGQPMLKAFDAIEFGDRTVYIVFDSDAATNPDIVAAELRFAHRLTERGAQVFICRLPGHKDVAKVGLDDFIVLNGIDALRDQVLEKAFPYAESVVLHDLNRRVVYVRDPGFIWDYDMTQRMTPGAFKEHAFSNVHFWEKRVSKQGETLIKVPAAKAWLEWEHRSECRGLTYAPGQDRVTGEGYLNAWQGWGVGSPAPGNVEHWKSLLLHLFGRDEEAQAWFERWCAYPLQFPGAKLATAAAIWGNVHGSGKTLVGHTLMRIYGKNSVELKDADLEDDRFEWAENKQFVLADDILGGADRKLMRRLMTMVTQKYVRLNPKYIPSYFIPDTMNYYYTSNQPDALFMDDQDRRFFVHEVRSGKYEDYKRYVEWRDSEEGTAALWHYLLQLDLAGFDPQAPAPVTQGKETMIEIGKSDLGAFVYELRTNTEAVLARAHLEGDLFTAQELHMLFDPSGEKRASPNALARELKRAGLHPPATGSKIRLADGTMRTVYAVRNMDGWLRKSWKEACDHYDASHKRVNGKKKF
jgi:hypothetical protein